MQQSEARLKAQLQNLSKQLQEFLSPTQGKEIDRSSGSSSNPMNSNNMAEEGGEMQTRTMTVPRFSKLKFQVFDGAEKSLS